MIIGIHISSGSPKSLATRDAERFGRLLIAKGGTDVFANGEAANLRTFAETLYGLVGRQDFLALRSTQNMASGAIAYSFLGTACTLVGGPTWAADGLNFSAHAQALSWPAVPASSNSPISMLGVHSYTKNNANSRCYMGGNNPTSRCTLIASGGHTLRGVDNAANSAALPENSMNFAGAIVQTATTGLLIGNGTQLAVSGSSWDAAAAPSGWNAASIALFSGETDTHKVPFSAYFPGLALTYAESQAIRTALKATLCAGLSMP